jgi:hypothetical protein
MVERNNAGDVTGLWPLPPSDVVIERRGKELIYTFHGLTGTAQFRTGEILHIRGLSKGSVFGLSPITLAKEAIGAGLAMEEYGARFFSNDGTPGGVLEYPGTLSSEAKQRLKESWEATQRGSRNAGRTAVLEAGLKYHAVSFTPEETLATVVFQPAFPSTELLVPLSVALEPGAYALVFGSDLFGATGNGAIPNSSDQADIPPTTIDSYIFYGIPGPGQDPIWRGPLASQMRFLVSGTTPAPVPALGPAGLGTLSVLLGLTLMQHCGRRRSVSPINRLAGAPPAGPRSVSLHTRDKSSGSPRHGLTRS